MKKIVFFREGRLFLDTGMSETVFVKTGLPSKIREEGFLLELSNGEWNLSSWNFNSTVSSLDLPSAFHSDEENNKKETVFLEGSSFSGLTLHEILSSSETEKRAKVSFSFCCALEDAFDFNVSLENIGLGGVFVSDNLDKILFLPKTLFLSSLSSLTKEEQAELHGFYVNPVLKGKAAIRFIQAVVVYRAITKSFPFPEVDAQKRHADILDLNYIPLRYSVSGLDESLLSFTETSFSGKTFKMFPKEALESLHEKPLSESDDFSFRLEKEKFLEKHKKRILAKRWFRAKSWAIRIASAIVAIVIIVSVSLYRSSLEKPTTKGLSSFETVEMYYSAINLLDVDSMRQSSIKNLSPRADRVSDIFVTGKTNAMYNPDTDLLPPSVWLVQGQYSRSIYGLSNLLIDGENASLFKKGAKKKEKPIVYSSSDSFPGSSKTFIVSFYIMDSIGGIDLSVVHQKESVKVVFQKDRWLVSDIQVEVEEQKIDFSTFLADIEDAKTESLSDVFKVAEILRQKYNFIPSDRELEDATCYLRENALFFNSAKLSF